MSSTLQIQTHAINNRQTVHPILGTTDTIVITEDCQTTPIDYCSTTLDNRQSNYSTGIGNVDNITKLNSIMSLTSSNDLVPSDDDDLTACDDTINTTSKIVSCGEYLPDIEAMPVNRMMDHMDYSDHDLAWSFLSNICFLFGGIAYLIQSTWDCFDDDPQTLGYRILDSVAPAIYVVNSIIDSEWSIRAKKRSDTERQKINGWSQWKHIFTKADRSISIPEILSTSSSVWKNEVRQYAAHRRTVLAALTFGIAAMIAFIASFVAGQYRSTLDNVSDHVYVLSSVIAITGKRSRQWLAASNSFDLDHTNDSIILKGSNEGNNNNNKKSLLYCMDRPEILRDLGDLLFFVGSVIDAVMGDLRVNAPVVSVFSAWLWFIDSCLYLHADVIRSKRIHVYDNNNNNNNNNELT
jgi:hypothetical protein